MSSRVRYIILFTSLCVFSATAAADVFYDTYQRGLAAFKAKEYADARAEFLRAYDLRPEPIILFNVAQTYRLELSSEQALAYYKRFLAESKIAEDLRKEAEAYVTHLEAEQAARDVQAKIDANAGPKERDGTPVNMTAPPMDRLPSQPSAIPPSDSINQSADTAARGDGAAWNTKRTSTLDTASHDPGPMPQLNGSPHLRLAAFISGGVGAAGVATGIYFGIRAKSLSDQVARVYEPADDQKGKAANRNMIISYSIGATGLVTCAILYHLSRRLHSSSVPVAGLSGGSIQLTWLY